MNDGNLDCGCTSATPCPQHRQPSVRCSSSEPIHAHFELTYAQYIVIPRTALQSMPTEWQAKFVGLLEQLDRAIDWRPAAGCYWVSVKDKRGRYIRDPLADYERGRRQLPLRDGWETDGRALAPSEGRR